MRGFSRDSSVLPRGSSGTVGGAQSTGTSPEEVMRKMLVKWLSFTIDVDLRDIRDLLRTEHLVAAAEVCCGRARGGRQPIAGTTTTPSVHEHDKNIEAVVVHLATLTEMEWGTR
jgi:hypothetical protein